MRVVLATLAEIKVTGLETGAGRRRPARQFRQFSPIFPVRDLAAALDHYATLGFETLAYADGADYGFANRDGTGLHLAATLATGTSTAPRRTCTSGTPTHCTRSGAAPVSAARPGRSARCSTGCAKGRTSTRTGT